jgi:hypothetical protein
MEYNWADIVQVDPYGQILEFALPSWAMPDLAKIHIPLVERQCELRLGA